MQQNFAEHRSPSRLPEFARRLSSTVDRPVDQTVYQWRRELATDD